MPTYEYECTSCGHRFEVLQSITEKPLRKCPRCGKKVTKLISAGGVFLFKGSGFYSTDYRSENYKKGAKKEGEGSEKKKGKEKSASGGSPPSSKEGGGNKSS